MFATSARDQSRDTVEKRFVSDPSGRQFLAVNRRVYSIGRGIKRQALNSARWQRELLSLEAHARNLREVTFNAQARRRGILGIGSAVQRDLQIVETRLGDGERLFAGEALVVNRPAGF